MWGLFDGALLILGIVSVGHQLDDSHWKGTAMCKEHRLYHHHEDVGIFVLTHAPHLGGKCGNIVTIVIITPVA